MKQRKAILGVFFVALSASPAFAQMGYRETGAYTILSAEQIEEANALLRRMAEIGALDVDTNENVQIKKSVLDELRKQGRVKEIRARAAVVCD